MEQRLLVVSPVRNEAGHFELVANALAAQTRPPDLWVVVDDGSTDGTPRLLAALAERISFMRVLTAPPHLLARGAKDRLATAAAPRTFNIGLRSVGDWRRFTHVTKLDGDIELRDDYYERLLAEFARDPQLGLAGGVWSEPDRDGCWKVQPIPVDHHVMGSLKCYSTPCLVDIGGVQERLGWDTIDQVYARMRGYRTRSFPDLVARHHRPWGSADGTLRGRARHGECAYIAQYPLSWVSLRAVKVASSRPRGLTGIAFLYGYLRSALLRVPRVEDREYRAFMRRELRARARRSLAVRARRRTALAPISAQER